MAAMEAFKKWRTKSGKKKNAPSRPPVRGLRPTLQKGRQNGDKGIFASRAMSIHGPKSVVVTVDAERPIRMQSSLRRGVMAKSVRASSMAMNERRKKHHSTKSLYPEIHDTSLGVEANNGGFETISLEVVPTDTTRSQDNLVASEQPPNLSPIEMKTFQKLNKAEGNRKADLEKNEVDVKSD